jgi:L-amino acid N-acyltransferase YncA
MSLILRPIDESNLDDYATLTCDEGGGGCYCAFWHQRFASHAEWMERCRTDPDANRRTVIDRVRSGFHVGVLAYEGDRLAGWISVGPLTEFFWAWKRVAALGLDADAVAGIVCITAAKDQRGTAFQSRALEALKAYGRARAWRSIEGYPFDASAIAQHGDAVLWPGVTRGFESAGFERIGAHWLSSPKAERSIYRYTLEREGT